MHKSLFYQLPICNLFPQHVIYLLWIGETPLVNCGPRQTGDIDSLPESLGQSILVVLCAGSMLFLTPVVRPAISQIATPSKATPFSYWSIKPWFLTEGKLTAVLIIPSSWGSQRIAITRASSNFSGAVAGEKKHFCKGSLLLPIFLLCYCFAYFIFVCFVISKTQKN